MKAIQVHQFIEDFSTLKGNDALMSMNEQVNRPTPKKGQILIKVVACSLSPGDRVMVAGNLIFLHESFPFVPGMDVCGIVEDPNESKHYSKGDTVVAANGMSLVGGMAEFMAVPEEQCVLKPQKISAEEGAASSSAITARNAVMDNVHEGDRVLILGGSGGVGSAAIQIAKLQAKASFVATTSTQQELCTKLGADLVVNYREADWWEKDWPSKFDVIIDTVGGGNFYGRADNGKVLKPAKQGGKFIAVCGDNPKPDARTVAKAISFLFKNIIPWRTMWTKICSSKLPKYSLLMPYDVPKGRRQVLTWMEDGALKVPLDEESPLPFTADGVRAAFAKVASGHAHGKVVVTMSAQ